MGFESEKRTRLRKRIWESNWAQKQDEVYLMDSAGELVVYTMFKFFLYIYCMTSDILKAV